MTLPPLEQSDSTSVERRLGETSGIGLCLLPHARDLGLLAKRVFRENSDTKGTVGTGSEDVEMNLIGLNRKHAVKFPRLYFELPSENLDRFVCLQKWEGYVIDVSKDSFAARLVDRTHGGDEEEAVFSVRRVSIEDRSLVRPGAMFYWNIGEHTDSTGRQRTTSELRFRRLPALSEADISAARREGKELHNWIIGAEGQS